MAELVIIVEIIVLTVLFLLWLRQEQEFKRIKELDALRQMLEKGREALG